MSGDAGRRAAPSAGTTVLEQAFDGDSLYALRSAVAAHASAAGLTRQRVYDVVTAAHELAANAVRHGAGHGRLRLWADGQALHCEVSDDGPGRPVGLENTIRSVLRAVTQRCTMRASAFPTASSASSKGPETDLSAFDAATLEAFWSGRSVRHRPRRLPSHLGRRASLLA